MALAAAAAFGGLGRDLSGTLSCLGDKLRDGSVRCGSNVDVAARANLLGGQERLVERPRVAEDAEGEPSVGASPVSGGSGAASRNPLAGTAFYVDRSSQAQLAANARPAGSAERALLQKIADQPQAVWLTGGSGSPSTLISRVFDGARGATPTFVAYNIPNRDTGSFSRGGVSNTDAYKAWINEVSKAIGDRKAVVILEPDALPDLEGLPNDAARAERLAMLRAATETFKKSNPNLVVYLDAGHPGWRTPAQIAERLEKAGVANTRGFSLNVSNYGGTESNLAYGNEISALTGAHFVIDTGRNGNGAKGAAWCNPTGRALGAAPRALSGGNADAYLWIKRPGESDGECNGGPSAGQWWDANALELARNAR